LPPPGSASFCATNRLCYMYVRCLTPSVLAFSLSVHRHPSICILFDSRLLLTINK
jgi:hypothetical protein